MPVNSKIDKCIKIDIVVESGIGVLYEHVRKQMTVTFNMNESHGYIYE